MSIRYAMPHDLTDIRRLLDLSGLPSSDLNEASLNQFLVLSENNAAVAAVGLEMYRDVALLRSLVVAQTSRGRGCGEQLVSAAETRARECGAGSIYLLTTNADQYFHARGYRPISRDTVPDAIRRTTQFSALCPSTAIVMVKP